MLDKTHTGVFLISGFLVNALKKKIVMTLVMILKRGPLTKLDKKKKHHQKNLTITSCRQIVTLLSFFRFMTNLDLFVSRLPDE